jgi:hypothetical protein
MPVNIERIKRNIAVLMDLNNESLPLCTLKIGTVFGQLSNTPDNKDNGLGIFGDILFAAFTDIAEAADISNPVPAIVTAILSGLVNSYNTTKPINLDKDLGNVTNRLANTSMQINTDLSAIYSDVAGNITVSYTIPDGVLPSPFNTKKTITVADLDLWDISGSHTSTFNSYVDALVHGFTRGLTKQQLPLIGGYSVGGVYIRRLHAYWVYIAQAPPGGSADVWTEGNYIINNQELQIQKRSVSVSGTRFEDFNTIAGAFCKQTGGYLVITGRSDSEISYKKYYLLKKFTDGDRNFNWSLGSDDFYNNFLFKDDGFGQIINLSGMGMREDIYRTWGITNGTHLPPSV